ncbi:MAG: EAL domain-containing protein [Pseudomonadota bacterium]
MARRKRLPSAIADLPSEVTSPINAAIAARDTKTLDMVAEAIERNNTTLAYQPVLQMRPPHGTAFYEGLIRVLDPVGRTIPARDFIHVAEPTELGREIDCLSLSAGLKTLAKVPDIRVSLNMSARSIGYRRWTSVLDRALKRNPTISERLILEITETSAISVPELVSDFMSDMQTRGIAFALDEFGGGLSNLQQLRDSCFDMVKIHGRFIRGIHANPDNQVLTAALVDVARHLDMFTVAVSVEDEQDALWLSRIGVDCVQGNLYGAPTVKPAWTNERGARKRA